MIRTRLALCLLFAAATPAFAGEGDIDKVNGSITVDPAQHAGDLDTVNGSIRIGANATAGDASTVNGSIQIGDGAHTGALETVNGGIRGGTGLVVDGGVETVNGSIFIDRNGRVSKGVGTVNQRHRPGVHRGSAAASTPSTATLTVGIGSHVRGRIRVEAEQQLVRRPHGQSQKPPRIIIGPNAVVDGPLVSGTRGQAVRCMRPRRPARSPARPRCASTRRPRRRTELPPRGSGFSRDVMPMSRASSALQELHPARRRRLRGSPQQEPRMPHPSPCAAVAALALAACQREAPAPAATTPAPQARGRSRARLLGRHQRRRFRRTRQDPGLRRVRGPRPRTPGEDKSVEYIKSQMQRMGLKPGDNGDWFQTVPMVETTADPDTTLTLSVGGKQRTLKFGDDMVVGTTTGEPEVNIKDSPLVFVGYGVDAPEQHWNDYAGLDVRARPWSCWSTTPASTSTTRTCSKASA